MITELIEFRLFRMPCCKQLLCWVNPRLPNRCPECGERVYQQLRTQPEFTLVLDKRAQLRLQEKP